MMGNNHKRIIQVTPLTALQTTFYMIRKDSVLGETLVKTPSAFQRDPLLWRVYRRMNKSMTTENLQTMKSR